MTVNDLHPDHHPTARVAESRRGRRGRSHDVQAEDGSFAGDLTDESGHTFSHTFDATGTAKYYCLPYKTMGMKSVVVVE